MFLLSISYEDRQIHESVSKAAKDTLQISVTQSLYEHLRRGLHLRDEAANKFLTYGPLAPGMTLIGLKRRISVWIFVL